MQGAAGECYIPLAPVSTTEVSVLGSLRYSNGGGVKLQSEEMLVFSKTFKLVLLHVITVPACQVQKVSQTLF